MRDTHPVALPVIAVWSAGHGLPALRPGPPLHQVVLPSIVPGYGIGRSVERYQTVVSSGRYHRLHRLPARLDVVGVEVEACVGEGVILCNIMDHKICSQVTD